MSVYLIYWKTIRSSRECYYVDIACGCPLIAHLDVSSGDYISKWVLCGSRFTIPPKQHKLGGQVFAKLPFK